MDTVTRQRRSEIMSRVRATGTRPELAVRRLVHGLDYPYRVQGRLLRGRSGLVIAGHRRVIFAHGIFWHRHAGCCLTRTPKSHGGFWHAKLDGNRERDLLTQRNVGELRGRSLVVWECELNKLDSVARRVTSFLEDCR